MLLGSWLKRIGRVWVLLGGCVTWVLVVGGKKPVPQSALAAAVQGANCSKTDAETQYIKIEKNAAEKENIFIF